MLQYGHLELADKTMDPGYIQHNPNVPQGRDGFKAFMSRMPGRTPQEIKPEWPNPPVLTLIDGPYSVMMWDRMAKDPDDPSKMYTGIITTWFAWRTGTSRNIGTKRRINPPQRRRQQAVGKENVDERHVARHWRGRCLRRASNDGVGAGVGPSRVKDCNRECLVGFMDGYMNAIYKHDPKAVPPLAIDVRMTENTGHMDVGEGVLWRSKVEPTPFKIYVADPVTGQVALQARLLIQGRSALVAVRLKVDRGQISEIEQLYDRNINDAAIPLLTTPRPGLVTDIPASERSSREVLALRRELLLRCSGRRRRQDRRVCRRLRAARERLPDR